MCQYLEDKKFLVAVHIVLFVVVFFVALAAVLTMIVIPCVVVVSLIVVIVMPFFVVFFAIAMLVSCETMYVTIFVEVYIEVFVEHVFFVTIVVDMQFVGQDIFDIPTIVLVSLFVQKTWLIVVGIVVDTSHVIEVDLYWSVC